MEGTRPEEPSHEENYIENPASDDDSNENSGNVQDDTHNPGGSPAPKGHFDPTTKAVVVEQDQVQLDVHVPVVGKPPVAPKVSAVTFIPKRKATLAPKKTKLDKSVPHSHAVVPKTSHKENDKNPTPQGTLNSKSASNNSASKNTAGATNTQRSNTMVANTGGSTPRSAKKQYHVTVFDKAVAGGVQGTHKPQNNKVQTAIESKFPRIPPSGSGRQSPKNKVCVGLVKNVGNHTSPSASLGRPIKAVETKKRRVTASIAHLEGGDFAEKRDEINTALQYNDAYFGPSKAPPSLLSPITADDSTRDERGFRAIVSDDSILSGTELSGNTNSVPQCLLNDVSDEEGVWKTQNFLYVADSPTSSQPKDMFRDSPITTAPESQEASSTQSATQKVNEVKTSLNQGTKVTP